MRVVVTGATGNVGSAVVRCLEDDDRITSVVGLARRLPDAAASVTSPSATSSVHHVAADITSDDLRPVFSGADAVIHLAWKIQPTHRPLETWNTNVLGSIRVFEACAETGVGTLVHASSIGAYAPGPDDRRPVDESWPTHSLPTAGYGREKAYVERVLDTFERDHPQMRVVRLRPAFVFQRPAASEQRRLFAGPMVRLVRRLLEHPPVVPVPPSLHVQAVHADDVADAYWRVLFADVTGAFNVAAGPALDGRDLARLLDSRYLALPEPLVRTAVWAAWHARLVPAEPALLDLFLSLPEIDSSRAIRELGWSPRRSTEEAIDELISGLVDGAGGATPPLHPDDPA